jgi:hypothetical protein
MIKAVRNILAGASEVTDIVDSRIYSLQAPQDSSTPYIVITQDGVDPAPTKEAASNIDTGFITIDMYNAAGAAVGTIVTLSEAVRTALDKYSGTIASETIVIVNFANQVTVSDSGSGGDYYQHIAQDYEVRKRN